MTIEAPNLFNNHSLALRFPSLPSRRRRYVPETILPRVLSFSGNPVLVPHSQFGLPSRPQVKAKYENLPLLIQIILKLASTLHSTTKTESFTEAFQVLNCAHVRAFRQTTIAGLSTVMLKVPNRGKLNRWHADERCRHGYDSRIVLDCISGIVGWRGSAGTGEF